MTAKPNTEDSGSTISVRNVVIYSVAILTMPIIGERLGELLQFSRLLELIEAVPAIVCALFVSRTPQPAKAAMHFGARAACLFPLFLLVVLGIGGLPSGACLRSDFRPDFRKCNRNRCY